MDASRARSLLLHLPHVVEVEQWGGLLYWVGEKAIGGKTFALMNLEPERGLPMSFQAGPEGLAEICERPGVRPAPYLARAFWVAVERWDALTASEWKRALVAAHTLTLNKLPKRTRSTLAAPK